MLKHRKHFILHMEITHYIYCITHELQKVNSIITTGACRKATTHNWNWPCMQATTHSWNWPCKQPLTAETDHACNHPQLKLTIHASNHSQLKLAMHATTHNWNWPCTQPLTTETDHACNHSQLKLTMHASNHSQLKLTMQATTYNPNSPCMWSQLKLTMQHSNPNFEFGAHWWPSPPSPYPNYPLRTQEESCCLSYHLRHCFSTTLRVGGCRINETNTKRESSLKNKDRRRNQRL